MTDASTIQLASILLTASIALVGSLIAYRQWRTAQNKLKIELFDRRLAVFEAIDMYLASSYRKHGLRADALNSFVTAKGNAQWLFDPTVITFCEKAWRTASDLMELWEEHDEHKKQLELDGQDEKQKQDLQQLRGKAFGKVLAKKKELLNLRMEWREIVAPYLTLRFR